MVTHPAVSLTWTEMNPVLNNHSSLNARYIPVASQQSPPPPQISCAGVTCCCSYLSLREEMKNSGGALNRYDRTQGGRENLLRSVVSSLSMGVCTSCTGYKHHTHSMTNADMHAHLSLTYMLVAVRRQDHLCFSAVYYSSNKFTPVAATCERVTIF